jgi:hypothetical protein
LKWRFLHPPSWGRFDVQNPGHFVHFPLRASKIWHFHIRFSHSLLLLGGYSLPICLHPSIYIMVSDLHWNDYKSFSCFGSSCQFPMFHLHMSVLSFPASTVSKWSR